MCYIHYVNCKFPCAIYISYSMQTIYACLYTPMCISVFTIYIYMCVLLLGNEIILDKPKTAAKVILDKNSPNSKKVPLQVELVEFKL